MTGVEGHAARQPAYGPWAADTDRERKAAARELRALALLILGDRHPLFAALGEAVADPAALDQAAAELARPPALRRRHLLSAYAALLRPVRSR